MLASLYEVSGRNQSNLGDFVAGVGLSAFCAVEVGQF